MAAYLLAKHHIFMLPLAGLACPHQRLLSCTLFRSSPCKGRIFGYPFGKILRLMAHHRFDRQLFGKTPVKVSQISPNPNASGFARRDYRRVGAYTAHDKTNCDLVLPTWPYSLYCQTLVFFFSFSNLKDPHSYSFLQVYYAVTICIFK